MASEAHRLWMRLVSDSEVETLRSLPDRFRHDPEVYDQFRSLSSTRSTSAGERILNVLADRLGISTDNLILYTRDHILTCLEQADAEQLRSFMKALAVFDYVYASQDALNEFNGGTGTWPLTKDGLQNIVTSYYFTYPLSYAYATEYVTAEQKERCLAICEELRSAFSRRLEAVDWMSATTKANAQKKLAAIRIHACYPDTWKEEGLAAMDGRCLLEDIVQLRAAQNRLRTGLLGKNAQDESFNMYIPSYNLTVVNAYYIRTCNAIVINPCFMAPPFYRSEESDAYNYSMFCIIGHEMTHAFDNSGANYDEKGNVRNWWTVSDKMEFEARCQKLVDCYDHLQVLPDEAPDMYTPGEQTLGENIADLGGCLMAYDAYMAKLAREGYVGQELEKEERRFCQGRAEIYRAKYNLEYANYALFKERVNGVMMNFDRWYDLFNVQWGDKLYLSKELRTYIW
ncbi:MAG: M13 family metallopeptidase [Paraprevotella sp.]|nr:M13 family metallopeptidase [Paraprevotella sp.]